MVLPDILNRVDANRAGRETRVNSGIGGGLIRFLSNNQSYDPANGLWTQNSTEAEAQLRIETERDRLLQHEYQVNLGALGQAALDDLTNLTNELYLSERNIFITNRDISSLNHLLDSAIETSTQLIQPRAYEQVIETDSYHLEIEDHINSYIDPTTTGAERELTSISMQNLLNICAANGIDPSDGGRLNYALVI